MISDYSWNQMGNEKFPYGSQPRHTLARTKYRFKGFVIE